MRRIFAILALLSLLAANAREFRKITSRIDLRGQTLELPTGTVLSFVGGQYANGTLRGENLVIEADPVQIFDGVRLSGSVANDEVWAEWFGDFGDDASVAVNSALAAAPSALVKVGTGKIPLKAPIRLDRDGQRLKVYGELVLASDFPAVKLDARRLEVDLFSVIYNKGGRRGTAVAFPGGVEDSSVSLFRATNLNKAFDITPSGPVRNNRVSFQYLIADYGIYYDLYSAPKAPKVEGNTFYGGRFQGGIGVYVDDSRRRGARREIVNQCFESVGFESVRKSLRLRDFAFSTFRDCRMAENLLDDKYIDFEGVHDLYVSIKGGTILDCIRAGRDCRDVVVDAQFCDRGLNLYHNFNRVALLPSPNPADSLSLAAVTTSVQPTGAPGSRRFERDTSIPYSDLYAAATPSGTPLLTSLFTASVAANRTLTVDFRSSRGGLMEPLALKVELEPGARVVLRPTDNPQNDIIFSESATYLLIREPEYFNLRFVKL